MYSRSRWEIYYIKVMYCEYGYIAVVFFARLMLYVVD